MSKRKNNFPKKSTKTKKGFTLIELLATLFIISLVFGITGYYAFNTINNSKDKTQNLTKANIKTSARIYVEENPDEIIWKVKAGEENPNTKYSCISILSLINKNYLKSSLLENTEVLTTKDNKQIEYVIVKKNTSNNTIVSEELDTTDTCQPLKTKVQIPTDKEYCNNLTYNGEKQSLLNPQKLQNTKYNFQNYLQTNAGDYDINISLNDKNKMIWSDGTNTDKTITCSIKKAIPTLSLTPNGGDQKSTSTTLQIHEPITGTITLKSSNKNYVTASTPNSEIKNGGTQTIQLNFLSSRQTKTYITVTFTPTNGYEQNYYSSAIVYTIDNITPQKIAIPTADYCNQNLVYNQSYQKLLNQNKVNKRVGFNFYDYEAIDAGSYEVTAKLQYGYIWNDNTTNDKKFKCSIQKATPILTLSSTTGEVIKTGDLSVQATSNVDGKINTVSKDSTRVSITSPNPANINLNTPLPITIHGKEITTNPVSVTVTLIPTDTKNYNNKTNTLAITVKSNIFRLTYDTNGGTACNPSSKGIIYNQSYGTLCTTTRNGYSFQGWFTAKTGGTQVTANTLTTGNVTIYAHWKDDIPPTCGSVSRSDNNKTWVSVPRTVTVSCNDSGSGCATATSSNTYNSGVVTTSYITIRDNAGNTTNCPVDVYMDREPPTCGTATGTNTGWSSSSTSPTTVSIACSDGNGSQCTQTYFSNYYGTATSTDYIVIRDNAGNTTSCPVNVYVDTTNPVCGTVTNDSTTWTSEDRTLSVDCFDTGSQCTQPSYSKEFTSTTDIGYIPIADNVGHVVNCPVNVYIDQTKPTCGTKTGTSTTWENGKRPITVACSDNHSGCSKSSFKYTFKNTTKTGTITIKDKVGNERACSVNVYLDNTNPTIRINKKRNYKHDGTTNPYCAERPQNTYPAVYVIDTADADSGLASVTFTWKKGCTNCVNDPVEVHTTTLQVSGKTKRDALCGMNSDSDVKYKVCDVAGNCIEGSYK